MVSSRSFSKEDLDLLRESIETFGLILLATKKFLSEDVFIAKLVPLETDGSNLATATPITFPLSSSTNWATTVSGLRDASI